MWSQWFGPGGLSPWLVPVKQALGWGCRAECTSITESTAVLSSGAPAGSESVRIRSFRVAHHDGLHGPLKDTPVMRRGSTDTTKREAHDFILPITFSVDNGYGRCQYSLLPLRRALPLLGSAAPRGKESLHTGSAKSYWRYIASESEGCPLFVGAHSSVIRWATATSTYQGR